MLSPTDYFGAPVSGQYNALPPHLATYSGAAFHSSDHQPLQHLGPPTPPPAVVCCFHSAKQPPIQCPATHSPSFDVALLFIVPNSGHYNALPPHPATSCGIAFHSADQQSLQRLGPPATARCGAALHSTYQQPLQRLAHHPPSTCCGAGFHHTNRQPL